MEFDTITRASSRPVSVSSSTRPSLSPEIDARALPPYERLNPSPLFSSFLLLALLFRLSARGEPRGMKIAPRLDARIHRAALESLLRSSFDLFLFRLVARDATQRRKSRGTDADPRYSGHEPLTTLARSKCASGTYAGIRATY